MCVCYRVSLGYCDSERCFCACVCARTSTFHAATRARSLIHMALNALFKRRKAICEVEHKDKRLHATM